MNKFFVSVMLIITLLATLVVSANASERYIERNFDMGAYAPVVRIDHALYTWTLDERSDGSLGWKKGSRTTFIVIPTDSEGWYVIREFTSDHYQRLLTYTEKGFRMEYPKTDSLGMPVIDKTQMFRFHWYDSTKCGGKTVKNCWRLFCRANGVAACVGGWSTVIIYQKNA